MPTVRESLNDVFWALKVLEAEIEALKREVQYLEHRLQVIENLFSR